MNISFWILWSCGSTNPKLLLSSYIPITFVLTLSVILTISPSRLLPSWLSFTTLPNTLSPFIAPFKAFLGINTSVTPSSSGIKKPKPFWWIWIFPGIKPTLSIKPNLSSSSLAIKPSASNALKTFLNCLYSALFMLNIFDNSNIVIGLYASSFIRPKIISFIFMLFPPFYI